MTTLPPLLSWIECPNNTPYDNIHVTNLVTYNVPYGIMILHNQSISTRTEVSQPILHPMIVIGVKRLPFYLSLMINRALVYRAFTGSSLSLRRDRTDGVPSPRNPYSPQGHLLTPLSLLRYVYTEGEKDPEWGWEKGNESPWDWRFSPWVTASWLNDESSRGNSSSVIWVGGTRSTSLTSGLSTRPTLGPRYNHSHGVPTLLW